MLLEPIIPPKDEHDPLLQQKLQVLAVSAQQLGLGATVEDVIFNLIPGVASRSVILPSTHYRDFYERALRTVVERIKLKGGSVVSTDRQTSTVHYRYRSDDHDVVHDIVHVRVLHTDVSFMQVAREAQEHADDPPVNYRQVRAEIVEIIAKDSELPESDRTALMALSRNPTFPAAELSMRYARAKRSRALTLLAEAYAGRCARAAYAAQRELSYSAERAAYAVPAWADLSDTERTTIVAVTTKVICGNTTPFVFGDLYGPLFVAVVQQSLQHFVGADALHERERGVVAAQMATISDVRYLM